jgi:hypothetical protein
LAKPFKAGSQHCEYGFWVPQEHRSFAIFASTPVDQAKNINNPCPHLAFPEKKGIDLSDFPPYIKAYA